MIVQLHLLHTNVTFYVMTLPTPTKVDHKRLGNLHPCLVAVQEFLDVFVIMKPAVHACFSGTHPCQSAHFFTTILGLPTLGYPGWDSAAVRSMADIVASMEKVRQRTRQVSEEAGDDSIIVMATTIDKTLAGLAARLLPVTVQLAQTMMIDNLGNSRETATEGPGFPLQEPETD